MKMWSDSNPVEHMRVAQSVWEDQTKWEQDFYLSATSEGSSTKTNHNEMTFNALATLLVACVADKNQQPGVVLRLQRRLLC